MTDSLKADVDTEIFIIVGWISLEASIFNAEVGGHYWQPKKNFTTGFGDACETFRSLEEAMNIPSHQRFLRVWGLGATVQKSTDSSPKFRLLYFSKIILSCIY
jgi:hypothetical protein